MKKILFCTFFILMFNFSFSQADEDFSYVITDTKNNDFFVYIEKVNYSSREIWIKRIQPLKTVKNKKGKYVKTGGGYTLQFTNIDCTNRTYDVNQSVSYDRNKNITSNDDFPSYGHKVIPGSVMSGIFDFVCKDE